MHKDRNLCFKDEDNDSVLKYKNKARTKIEPSRTRTRTTATDYPWLSSCPKMYAPMSV